MKTPRKVKLVTGFVSTISVIIFVPGLAWSISTGFAGFWGGLPFWVISIAVLAMVVYEFWDDCVRRKGNGGS